MRRALIGLLMLGAAPTHKRVDPDAKIIAAAKTALASRMRDPSSVQFKEIHVGPGQLDGKAVCGMFNAKNGFGGYEGFQLFVYESVVNGISLSDDPMFPVYVKDCPR